jgi:hypothetical protein
METLALDSMLLDSISLVILIENIISLSLAVLEVILVRG